jgi:aldose sugar dehydrogenase
MRKLRKASVMAVASAIFIAAGCGPSEGHGTIIQAEGEEFRITVVLDGLDNPWGIAFLPDGGFLVTERPGRLRVYRDGALDPDPVDGVPDVRARGQGGLLDVTLHPDFPENRLVYLSYSKPLEGGEGTTAVARGRFDGTRLTEVEDIFVARAASSSGSHFGSRLQFDRDGYLFVTVGDRGSMREAQNLQNHIGTTLRLHADGSVPQDNPFVGRDDALPEIWSYGHRNPQGMALHPETGEIWQNEHGPRGGDELNLIRPGANYGWPEITHGINYDGSPITQDTARAGMEQPVLHWTPSIAVSGMDFYTGDAFPSWRGNIFVGALAQQHIRRVTLEGNRVIGQESLLTGFRQRIREVKSGPDGYLYLLTDHSGSGQVVRLEPAR